MTCSSDASSGCTCHAILQVDDVRPLVTALLEHGAVQLLVQRLASLDEEVEEEQGAVSNILSLCGNLVETDERVAEALWQHTKVRLMEAVCIHPTLLSVALSMAAAAGAGPQLHAQQARGGGAAGSSGTERPRVPTSPGARRAHGRRVGGDCALQQTVWCWLTCHARIVFDHR